MDKLQTKAPVGPTGAHPVLPRPSGQWFIVDSDIFNEPILCVSDPADLASARSEHPQLVPYLAREVDALYSHRENAELLQAIHRIKKHLGGHVRSDDVA